MTKRTRSMAGALVVGLGAVALGAVVIGEAHGQSQPSAAIGAGRGVVIAERTTVAATVEDIDRSQRTVTLKGQEGKSVTLKVSDQVRNLDQVDVGDTVQAEYLKAVAIVVLPSGASAASGETRAVKVAPRGGTPAATVVETKQITATVEAIDYDTREVTLRGPGGDSRTVVVDPSVERLRDVKVGDEVVVRHTEAVALTVKKGS
jgi:hypothetical protein